MLALCLQAQLMPEHDAPNPEEVRFALDRRGGSDDAFAEWGDAALFQLLTLIGTRSGNDLEAADHAWALARIGTPAAYDVLIQRFVEGEPIPAVIAEAVVHTIIVQEGITTVFDTAPHFKPAVTALTEHDHATSRSSAAEIWGVVGWTDTEPLLREMLDDPILKVRKQAARAIGRITGTRVEYDRPPPRFPREDRARFDTEEQGFAVVEPITWTDGRGLLACTRAHGTRSLDGYGAFVADLPQGEDTFARVPSP